MGREKRKYQRIEAKVQVEFQTVEDLATEFTKNISKGGIFLKTDRLLDPNAEIDLRMVFPKNLGEFRVQGRVVRVMSVSHPTEPGVTIHGAGIRFVDPIPELLDAIERVIQTKEG